VSATTPAAAAREDCSFAYPTGASVQLAASTHGATIWGGACAHVTVSTCSLTLAPSNVFVSVTY
jgi:hypothetical protein